MRNESPSTKRKYWREKEVQVNLGPNVGDIICWVTRPSWAGSPNQAIHLSVVRALAWQDRRLYGGLQLPEGLEALEDGDLEIVKVTVCRKESTLVKP